MKLGFTFIISLVLIVTSCKVRKEEKSDKNKSQQAASTTEEVVVGNAAVSAPVMIYKTSKDYFNYIPIALSDDKSKVVSFPGITDIKMGEEYRTPVRLNNGYLLDKQGVNKNIAFIKYTYEEYANLDKTPTANQLFDMIIDKDPLTELYFCGSENKFDDKVKELNEVIDSGDMSQFKRIK